jgi:hypothetical protein
MEGESEMVRAGWIGGPWGSGVSDHRDIDNFVVGGSDTVSGQVDIFGPAVDMGVGETWGNLGSGGHNDFATEWGLGTGSPGPSGGVTHSYSWHVWDSPLSW